MWKYIAVAVVAASLSIFAYAYARPQITSPGLMPFTPTRIDWLTTTLEAALRENSEDRYGYVLEISSNDPETVLIMVRYTPNVNRRQMNTSIDVARIVIQKTVMRYGWDQWVKIREDIQPAIK